MPKVFMVTQFIRLEVPLLASAGEMQQSILTALQQVGEPLRWAITTIDYERQIAQVEAVVTTPTEFHIPGITVQTV